MLETILDVAQLILNFATVILILKMMKQDKEE